MSRKPAAKTVKRDRTVIFVDCARELKARVKKAAAFTDRGLSDYVVHALKRQLVIDEAKMPRNP